MSRAADKRGAWIPWVFVGAFGVVLVANGALIAFSIGSFSGVSTDDAYRRGLAFNAVIAEKRTSEALGWRLDARLAPDGWFEAELVDADGAGLQGAALAAHFVRPTQSGYDVEIALAPLGGGRYGARVVLPLAGQWALRLRATRDGQSVTHTQRIHSPG
jgi:nitrogen fixation protein FixH